MNIREQMAEALTENVTVGCCTPSAREARDIVDLILSILANPSDELVERCARVLHGNLYGYEGVNPNSNPDDEDRHIIRAVLAAAVGEG